MDINETTLQNIATWYRSHWSSAAGGRNHYLHYAKFRSAQHVIYGMDDPQTCYLALLRLTGRFQPDPSHAHPATTFRRFVENNLANNKGNKIWDSHVSNYILDLNADDIGWTPTAQPSVNRAGRPTSGSGEHAREQARDTFTDSYENSHFGLRNATMDKVLSGAQKNRPHIDNVFQGGYSNQQFATDMKSYAVRRACKFLMYESISEGKTVVYALDDLNLAAVADRTWLVDHNGSVTFKPKDEAASAPGFKKVPVCTTEIRELFRCWDYFSGTLRSGHPRVHFMKDFVAVTPPWQLGDQATWSAYAVRLAEKWFAQLPTTVQASKATMKANVRSRHLSGDHQGAIAAYHGLGIGAFKHGQRALPVQA